MAVEKVCEVCGKKFLSRNRTYKTCSKECHDILKRQTIRACRERLAKKRDYTPDSSQLDTDARKAKEYGVSYGYYMAIFKPKGGVRKSSLGMKN